MMWLGILMVSAVLSFVLSVAALAGKGNKAWANVVTYLIVTAIIFVLVSALTIGGMLIAEGIRARL